MELTSWTAQLTHNAKDIPSDASLKIPGKSWEEVLFEANDLRHAAVHRRKIDAYGLMDLTERAELLARMLRDIPLAQQIEVIRGHLKSSIEEIEEMEGHKRELQGKLSTELQSIARKRAALDALEGMAIKGIVQSDIDMNLATRQMLTERLFSSGAGAKIESGDTEASNTRKSVAFEQDIEDLKSPGRISRTRRKALEHEDEVLDTAQSSPNPETTAIVSQNDHVTESIEEISCLPPSDHVPRPYPPEEHFLVTESGPSFIHLAKTTKTKQLEDVQLPTNVERKANFVEVEVWKPKVIPVENESLDEAY